MSGLPEHSSGNDVYQKRFRNLDYRAALIGCLALLLIVMIYFDVLFSGQLPDHPLVYGWNDLILRLGAFGLLSMLTFAILGTNRIPVLTLTATAGLFEAAQMFLPGRELALTDLLANLLGVGSALAAFALSRKFLGWLRCSPSSPEKTRGSVGEG